MDPPPYLAELTEAVEKLQTEVGNMALELSSIRETLEALRNDLERKGSG